MQSECGFDRQHQPRNLTAGSNRSQRFQRFAGIRREKQLHRIEPIRARLVQRSELRFELRLLEPKIDQVFPNRLRKSRFRFCAQLVQYFASAIHLCANFFDFVCESLQLRVASFDFAHPFRSALTEFNHLGNRAAVFSFQRFEKRNALLERGKLLRIEIEFFSIIGERARDLGEFDDGGFVPSDKLRNGIVDLFQLTQKPLRFREL